MQGDAAQGPLGLIGLGMGIDALEHQQYAGPGGQALVGVDARLPAETPNGFPGFGIGRLKQCAKLLQPALAAKDLQQARVKRV